MSTGDSTSAGSQPQASNAAPKVPPKRNPLAQMMGLPRLRLPSRNWMIFLGSIGAFAGAVTYDRREKKRVQKKWCDLVSHLAQDPLPINETRRKLTIFLAAPPGDSLRPTRDYFRQYIKPVLVAAAIDYDVIEGRKEGDVRYGTAEQIRRRRRKNGESGQPVTTDGPDVEHIIDAQRSRAGIQEELCPKGDLVIGRHVWKEYVRGVHEGWLGPLDRPEPLEKSKALTGPDSSLPSEGNTADAEQTNETSQESEEETKLVDPKASYLPVSSYSESELAPTTPTAFEATGVIPQPHILGFLNTPIRIYRYLTQRRLADEVGRQTAGIVLAMAVPFERISPGYDESASSENSPVMNHGMEGSPSEEDRRCWAQQNLLDHEEQEWHKSVRKTRDDDFERTWLDDVVMDDRIAERMRRFKLDPKEEERAERIAEGLEKPIGFHEEEPERKVVVDNLDDSDA